MAMLAPTVGMHRRDWLKVAGGGTIALAGGATTYALFLRDGAGDDDGQPLDELRQAAEESDTRPGDFLLGVAPASRDLTVMDPFEAWLDKQHAVVGTFVDMGEDATEIDRLVYGLFESTWERGHVPHIWWQPFFPDRESTSQEVIRELHEGEWDDVLHDWADALAGWATESEGLDRRIYLNLAPEFNGDWSPWSPALGNVDEDDFAEMWRHVHDIVMDAGLERDHVQWIWTLDNSNRIEDREACYPGDDYVDWCGVHGYNWVEWTDDWLDPDGVYGPTIDFVEGLTDKPIAITEFGTSAEDEDGSYTPERKDAWIESAYDYVVDRDVKMTLYFNIDIPDETDWRAFDADPALETAEVDGSEYGVYPAYREAATADGALDPHPEHPRLLTDAEFFGEF